MVLEIKISKHLLSKVFLSFIFLFIIAVSALAIPFFFFYNDSTSVNAATTNLAAGTCSVGGTVFQKGANTGLCALAPEQSWAVDYKNAWCGKSIGDADCGCPSRSNSDFTSHGQNYNFCDGTQITAIPTTTPATTTAKLPEGSVCTNPTQCSSNSCMNGYCVLDCSQASNKARCSCGATLCVDASANNGAGNPADRYACSIERPGVCLKNGAACAPSTNDGKSIDCDPAGGVRQTCSGSQNVSTNIVTGGTCSRTTSTCSGPQALSCGGMTGYTLGNYGTYANKVVNVNITTNTGETIPSGEIVVKLSTRNNNAIVGGKLASNAPGGNAGANAVGNASCMDPATIVNTGSERTGASNSGNSAQLTGVQCFNAPFDIYIDSTIWELVSQDASQVTCTASSNQGANNATLVVRKKVITTTTPVVTTAPSLSAQCVSLNIVSSNGMQRCYTATGQFNNINADHIDIVPYDGGPASSFNFPAQSGTFTSSSPLCFTYPADGKTYTARAYAYVQDSSKQNIVTGNGVGSCTQVIVGQQITTTPPTTTIITTTPPTTTPPTTTIITTTPPITTTIITTTVTSTPPTTTEITTTPPVTTTVTPHSTVLAATTGPVLVNTGQGTVLFNILAGFGLLAIITIVLMSRGQNQNHVNRFTNAENIDEDNWFSYLTNLPNKMEHTQIHNTGKETPAENFYTKALYSITPINSPEYYREQEQNQILKMLYKSFGKSQG